LAALAERRASFPESTKPHPRGQADLRKFVGGSTVVTRAIERGTIVPIISL
jgi:hypothetical protein